MTAPPLIGRNYLKPPENDKVPIIILDFQKMYACWLPGLRHTLYFNTKPETEELKRIRKVVLLEVFSVDAKYMIELTPEDFEQFETAYSLFIRDGGEIYFYRRKEGRRMKRYFEFRPKKASTTPVRKYTLDEAV